MLSASNGDGSWETAGGISLSKPNSVLPLVFCFACVLPSSLPLHPPAPPPPPLSAMATQKAKEMGRAGEEWRRESKREKREST